MMESNGQSVQSPAPDFKGALKEAKSSGDFDFVLRTAKDSDRMLREFKQAVLMTSFAGRDARAVAMGLNFLDNMMAQSAAQIEQLKRAEKATREAFKAAHKSPPMTVVGAEGADTAVPQAPVETPAQPIETPAPAAEGWETPPNG